MNHAIRSRRPSSSTLNQTDHTRIRWQYGSLVALVLFALIASLIGVRA